MFTGIITNTTKVLSQKSNKDGLLLEFARPGDWDDLELGESIATDGVCLTVASKTDKSYTCHLIPETLRVSTFGTKVPESVNLERSLKLGDRLSGHMVQGHVDAVSKVAKIDKSDGYQLYIETNKDWQKLVVHKGAITVNGVSLTVASKDSKSFSVALVPYTLGHTTLGSLSDGDLVNLEFDIVGKYILQDKE
jgi:riboflavin synthase